MKDEARGGGHGPTHPSSLILQPSKPLSILAVGTGLELVLLAGLVGPLWLFGPRAAITAPEPLAAALGATPAGMLWFAATLALWLAGYAVVLALCQGPLPAGARRLLAAFPLLFAVTLLFVLPVSSQDVYHYALEGRILAVYGANPALTPPAAIPDDPLAWTVTAWRDEPSPYGPAFNLAAGAVALAGRGSLTATVLGFKLLAVAALLGSAALAWLTVRPLRADLALPAYVLVAWNPLALYEAGANAHNSLLMAFWTALALYWATRRRWALALPALTLGALTKYVVALLGPLLVLDAAHACEVRHVRGPSGSAPPAARMGAALARLPRGAWAGLAVSAALVVALYAPFWAGVRTFTGVGAAADDMLSSPGWLLRQTLKHALGWERAGVAVVALMTALFLAGYALLLVRAARRPRPAPGWDAARGLAGYVLAVLVVQLGTVSWGLWPWYSVWLLPPAALLVGTRSALLTAVITGGALAAYVPINFRELFWGPTPTDAMPLAALLTMALPPLVAAAWLKMKDKG
jgi:alpha-1,6-mannosyltransferase